MGRLSRQFEPVYEATAGDIFAFCELLNFEPTWQQADVLRLVMEGHKRIGVKSGQGPGKTTISSVVGLWRGWRAYDARTVVTAPTMRQAKGNWLSEVRRLLEGADPILQKLIKPTKSLVLFGGRPNWVIELITATKTESAQGVHNNDLTVIVEEASGVKREIIEQFEGTITNENALLLMIGNPNTRDCGFFDCFNRFRHKWATLTLNTEDSTKIMVKRGGKLEPMVSPENIAYIAEKYGVDSDVYRIRVLGEFPHSDPNCVVSSEDCEKVTKTKVLTLINIPRRGSSDQKPARQFGIDFARFGSDESVVYRRSGNAILEWKAFSKVDPNDVVDYAFRLQAEAGWKDDECWYVADATGIGQGIMGKFHRAGKQIVEFHNHGIASTQEYDNKVTEAWFRFAELAKKGSTHIPNDNRLIQQLSTRQYYTTAKGKLILESKEDYKKRSNEEEGASPDRADALCMAFYDAVEAVGHVSNKKREDTRVGVRRLGIR